MMRSAIATVLLVLPTLVGATESAARTDESPVVFRLSPDGEWLGAVKSDAANGDAALAASPLQPASRAGLGAPVTIGGLFSLPDGARVSVSAKQQQWAPVLAVLPAPPAWCQGIVGMVAGGTDCAPQVVSGVPAQPMLTARQGGASIGSGDWDLSLGVATLNGWSPGSGLWLLPPPGAVVASVPLLATPGGWVNSRELQLSGLWRLAPWGGLTVSASVGEGQWQVVPGTAPLSLDQAALQFGLARGAFSGGITGRVVRPTGPFDGSGSLWGGLDIGIAWRTPWRGELSFGARNVVRGSREPLPSPTAPMIDEATARTPYVRYTQDL